METRRTDGSVQRIRRRQDENTDGGGRESVPEIEKLLEKKISVSVLKKTAKRCGPSWKRIKKVLKNKRDPDKFDRVKKVLSSLIKKEAAGEIDLYCFDESGFTLDPYIPYAWRP